MGCDERVMNLLKRFYLTMRQI